MQQLTKISSALAAVGLSAALLISPSYADTKTNPTNPAAKNDAAAAKSEVSPVTNGVSQKTTGDSKASKSLNKFLPTIKYSTEGLSATAQKVNSSNLRSRIYKSVAASLQTNLRH